MRQLTYHRRSIRLPTYDYAQFGYYFVTICTQDGKTHLGKINQGIMQLSLVGRLVEEYWLQIPVHFANIELGHYVIMPNHIHGIIIIRGGKRTVRRGAVSAPSWGGETPPLQSAPHKPTLGQIIAYFKYQSTKKINIIKKVQGQKFWQRNYYEHIIRQEESMEKIHEYILKNSENWQYDHDNPINIRSSYGKI